MLFTYWINRPLNPANKKAEPPLTMATVEEKLKERKQKVLKYRFLDGTEYYIDGTSDDVHS
jgi:hypothetical protein